MILSWKKYIYIVPKVMLLLGFNMCIIVIIHGADIIHNYQPPEGGRLYDMKVVSGYVILRNYNV